MGDIYSFEEFYENKINRELFIYLWNNFPETNNLGIGLENWELIFKECFQVISMRYKKVVKREINYAELGELYYQIMIKYLGQLHCDYICNEVMLTQAVSETYTMIYYYNLLKTMDIFHLQEKLEKSLNLQEQKKEILKRRCLVPFINKRTL